MTALYSKAWRFSPSATLMLLAAPKIATGQVDGPPALQVGPNVHVSRQLPRASMRELRICSNPRDTRDLFVIGMTYTPTLNALTVRGYRSRDGGMHWTLVFEPSVGVAPGRNASHAQADPECAYGVDGSLVAMFLGETSQAHRAPADSSAEALVFSDVAHVFRLAPGGGEWHETQLPFHDRPYMSVDTSEGQHRGTIYIADNAITLRSPGLFRSTDGGASFLGPVQPDSGADTTLKKRAEFYQSANPGQSAVLLSGAVAIPRLLFRANWDSCCYAARYRIDVVVATDGGTRFLQPSVVEEKASRVCYVTATALAQDQSDGPFRGRIYVTWAGMRGAHCEILLSHSDDEGKAWSRPMIVTQEAFRSDAHPGGDHELPYVAVNRRGVVGLSWYDFRDDPDPARPGYALRFAASADGGETFSQSVAVSSVHSRWRSLSEVGLLLFSGSELETSDSNPPLHVTIPRWGNNRDTNGLLADADGTFHPVWIDNRTGLSQIWTATVRVAGSAVKHGARTLAALDDVTDRVEMVAANVAFDRKSRRLSADLAIRNTSALPISGPLFVRVIGITPAMTGTPSVLGTANHESGVGAILDFSSGLTGPLASGTTSRPKRITLQLSPEQWVTVHQTRTRSFSQADGGDDPSYNVFPGLDLRVYGHH
jgi:hypothetical protein